jgi:hypothetical protein
VRNKQKSNGPGRPRKQVTIKRPTIPITESFHDEMKREAKTRGICFTEFARNIWEEFMNARKEVKA